MKTLKLFNEWILTSEDKKDNVSISNNNLNDIKKQNMEYNKEVIPDEFKDKDPNFDIVISKKIEIGEKNPVLKFKEWDGEYWEKKKDKNKTK